MEQSSTFSARLLRGVLIGLMAIAFTNCGSSDGPAAGGDTDTDTDTDPGTPSGLPALFSSAANTVDFNSVDLSTFDDTTYFDFLAGNDVVTLPNDNTAGSHAALVAVDPSLTFSGGDGNDTISAANSNLNFTINGGGGNDLIILGSGNDTVDGGDDNDTIQMLFSNYNNALDTINGGAGTDTLAFTDAGPLNIDLGATLTSVSSIEGIIMTDAADTITAIANVELTAKGGNDILTGSAGNDTIHGGSGDDTINGNAGDDVLNGDDGVDTINGGDDNDTINGGAEGDILDGGAGNDTINGGDGDDTITMGTGTDVVNMGAGADTLVCSQDGGVKTVTGGTGADIFQLCRASASSTMNVLDLSTADADVIQFSIAGLETPASVTDLQNGAGGSVANTNAISMETFDVAGGPAPLAAGTNLVYIIDGGAGTGFPASTGVGGLKARLAAAEMQLNGGGSAGADVGILVIWLNTTSGNYELGLVNSGAGGAWDGDDFFSIAIITPNAQTVAQVASLIANFVP